MTMLTTINDILMRFRNNFQNQAAFRWFCLLILGIMVRDDKLGITSVVRSLLLNEGCYILLVRFFRSRAWELYPIRVVWAKTVSKYATTRNGRVVLAGDHKNAPHNGRCTPGVKKLAQSSETQSKPDHFFGWAWGCVSCLIGGGQFHCPLSLRIHDGLQSTADWPGSTETDARDTMPVKMISDCFNAALALGRHSIVALDRYFLCKPLMAKLKELNDREASRFGGKNLLEVVAMCKRNYNAFEFPPESSSGKKGRKRKKGATVKLWSRFETADSQFSEETVTLYGKKHKIRYYSEVLLWGSAMYIPIRFVWCVMDDGRKTVFACTDTTWDAMSIISLYSTRFRIETLFRDLSQVIGGFGARFWTKCLCAKKLDRYASKLDPDNLSEVTDEHERALVLQTINVTNMYALISCIAIGILQILSIKFHDGDFKAKLRYQRTPAGAYPSPDNIACVLRKMLFLLIAENPNLEISEYVMSERMSEEDMVWTETD